MSNKLCLLISFVLLLGLASSASANLILNGSVEDGVWVDEANLPDYWWSTLYPSEGWSWATWKDVNDAHTGTKVLCVGGWGDGVGGGGEDGDGSYYSQEYLNASPGDIYKMSAWVKTEYWWGDGDLTYFMRVEFRDASNTLIRRDDSEHWTGHVYEWTEASFSTDPAPAGTTRLNFVVVGEACGSIWFDDMHAVVMQKASDPEPADGAKYVPRTVTLSWNPGTWVQDVNGHEVYFGTDETAVSNADRFDDTGIYRGNTVAGPDPNGRYSYTVPETLDLGQYCYWRIDEVNETYTGPAPQTDGRWKGFVWKFRVTGAALNPSPEDGAVDVSLYTDLSWTPGTDSDGHDVYFGTSESKVTDATIDVNFGLYMGRQDTNDFNNVPVLDLGQTYYWRIDEVNTASATLVKGFVWSFTTEKFLVVEDFDSYANTTELTNVWDDYWGNGSGAEIYLETDLTNNGNCMMFNYKNDYKMQGNIYGSWADADTIDLPVSSDWTIGSPKALRLAFYGDAANSATVNDKMYIALNDGVTVHSSYYPDVNDIKDESWREWNIDLEEFETAGVNLANATRITIGFGTYDGGPQGGTGIVYFDDIELQPTRCVPDHAYPWGDLTGDCLIDFYDVEVMAGDWLVSDYNFIATEPCEANLIGWWKFDEGMGLSTEDSSAYTNDGTIVDADWATGYPNDPCDSALHFDGDGSGTFDKVVCAVRDGNGPGTYPAELMPDTFTVSCWTKLDNFEYFSSFITNGLDTGDDECGFFLYNYGWVDDNGNDFGLVIRTETAMSYVETQNIYQAGTWYHLAATYDGQYAKIYVDGELSAGPVDVGGPIRWISAESGNYPENFVIGAWEDPGWRLFIKGVIDEVRYYNWPLLQGHIAVLAGNEGDIYAPLDLPSNYVPRVPDPAVDPNYYPDNPDIINLRDFGFWADNWLREILFP